MGVHIIFTGRGRARVHVKREPITAIWGQSPQRGPGAQPLVRGRGLQRRKLLSIYMPKGRPKTLLSIRQDKLIIPAKARECFHRRSLVCLSVTTVTITKKVVNGYAPNCMQRFLGGNGRSSSCFDTIGRGMWK